MTDGGDTREVYLSAVTSQVPRLLGLLNRNCCSASYGCFDRNYWHYRVVDTPSARCQEAVLTLALLHQISGTGYSNEESLIVWANAGLKFWLKIQQPNGTFNEWYPKENSFVATAFTTYGISETALLLGFTALDDWVAVEGGLVKAGQWLLRKGEARALNQFAGSALALYNLFLVTGERRFEKGAADRVASLRQLQNTEGWFEEYGGADIGYLSLTVAYLAKLYRKSRWPEVLELAITATEFIRTFLHRDFTSGGEYCSRLTEYLMPDGFEILATESAAARSISLFVREAIKRQTGVSLFSFDDRYLTYVAYNFLEAFRYGTANLKADLGRNETSHSERTLKSFPEAGLAVINDEKFEGVVNIHRGGAFKFVFANGVTISDCGTILISRRNAIFHAGISNSQVESVVEKYRLWIRGRFSKINDTPMDPLRNILFRVFQMTIGRIEHIGFWLKNFLRNVLIMPQSTEKVYYERAIELKGGGISVRDTISCPVRKLRAAKIVLASRGSFLYTPSSKFFTSTDLHEKSSVVVPVCDLRKGRRIQVSREYAADGRLLNVGIVEL